MADEEEENKACDCKYEPIVYPFVGTTEEEFDRFNSKGVKFDCGTWGTKTCNIPRYLAMNCPFGKGNMVKEGQKFVMVMLDSNEGEVVPISIYEG